MCAFMIYLSISFVVPSCRQPGMSYRVYPYSLSGGKSIDWLPGVPLAAWGGPGRTQGAVGAAPKTRNYTTPRYSIQ